MITTAHRFAIAEEVVSDPLIVRASIQSRKGELVLVQMAYGGYGGWAELLDPIWQGADGWTCRRLTDQEFSDHIRNELLEKEKNREWSAEKILAMHKGIPA